MKVKVRVIQLRVSLMFRIGSLRLCACPLHHSLEVTKQLSNNRHNSSGIFSGVDGYRINAGEPLQAAVRVFR